MRHGWLRKSGVVGVLAAVVLSLAPVAQAKYPPTIPNSDCIQLSTKRVRAGHFFRVSGAPGCALNANGQPTVVRILLGQDRRVVKDPAPNGAYNFAVKVPPKFDHGRAMVKVRTGGKQFNRFIFVVNPPPPEPSSCSFSGIFFNSSFLCDLLQSFGFFDGQQLASATLEEPRVSTSSLWWPSGVALAIVAIGGWFVFAPPRRRRRLVRRRTSGSA